MVSFAQYKLAAASLAATALLALPVAAQARSVVVAVGTPGVALVDQTSGRVGASISIHSTPTPRCATLATSSVAKCRSGKSKSR